MGDGERNFNSREVRPTFGMVGLPLVFCSLEDGISRQPECFAIRHSIKQEKG